MDVPSRRYRVLLVDDEINVLHALRRELTTPPLGRNHYDVETFTSPRQALEHAQTQAFDLVISDYLMPEMTGLAFLQQFSKIHPAAARILLSGQADIQAVRDAVNDTHIYRFIGKPWHDYYLKGSVSQALAWREQLLQHHCLADEARRREFPRPLPEESDVCTIMVVDDEEAVTQAIYRELTRHDQFDDIFGAMRFEETGTRDSAVSGYKFIVYTFTSPQKALQAAREMPYHCVISDYRMLGMDGIEFLQVFEAIQPDCARIMVSAYTDMPVLLGAINDAHVYSFFNKPWNEFELKSAITQAISQRRLLMENRLLATALKQQRPLG